MKGFFLLFALFVINAHASGRALPARNNNYCMEDIYRYFEQKFQSADHVAKLTKIGAISGSTWYFYVSVDFCSGNFVMDMNDGDPSICTNPQYGRYTQTVDRVYATGDCRRYLPNDDFPRLYN